MLRTFVHRRAALAAASTILVAATATTSAGQWSTDATLNTPVAVEANAQAAPSIVSDGSGGMLIAWQDARAAAGSSDIYVQHVDAAGALQWTTNGRLAAGEDANETRPVLLSDGGGSAFAVWERETPTGTRLFAQHLDTNGGGLFPASGLVVTDVAVTEWAASTDAAGGFLVAFASGDDVSLQHVDVTGALLFGASGLPLCADPAVQSQPIVVDDGQGGAYVFWRDARGVDLDLYGQKVDASGAIQWTFDGLPICIEPGDQSNALATADGLGNAYLGWEDGRNPSVDLYAQLVTPAGELLWRAEATPLCLDETDQHDLSLTVDAFGSLLSAWVDSRFDEGGGDVFGQRTDAVGTTRWGNLDGLLICSTVGTQRHPKIVSSGAAGAIVVWEDPRSGELDLYAGAVDASGAVAWGPDGVAVCTAAGVQSRPAIIVDGLGGAIVAWQDERDALTTGLDIYAQQLDQDGGLATRPVSVETTDPSGSWELSFRVPNPAAPTGVLRYNVPAEAHVALRVYDMEGREVLTLVDERQGPGDRQVRLRAEALPSGVYVYRLDVGGRAASRKVCLSR